MIKRSVTAASHAAARRPEPQARGHPAGPGGSPAPGPPRQPAPPPAALQRRRPRPELARAAPGPGLSASQRREPRAGQRPPAEPAGTGSSRVSPSCPVWPTRPPSRMLPPSGLPARTGSARAPPRRDAAPPPRAPGAALTCSAGDGDGGSGCDRAGPGASLAGGGRLGLVSAELLAEPPVTLPPSGGEAGLPLRRRGTRARTAGWRRGAAAERVRRPPAAAGPVRGLAGPGSLPSAASLTALSSQAAGRDVDGTYRGCCRETP